MRITLGTDNGVWFVETDDPRQTGLAGRQVSHVAADDSVTLAAVAQDGLYVLDGTAERRIWEGDARSCAVAPDGAYYVGIEPAMILRSDDQGAGWTRCDAIDHLPSREQWTFPPPPHEPHVLSIDFLPDDPAGILAGVEVGGVLLSRDRGGTWHELNAGVYADIHSVRPDPSQPGRLLAVTGDGFYASETGGASWEKRMEGMGNWYTIGLHINPRRAGDVLVVAGDRPPGLNGRVYYSSDAGKSWEELNGAGLPAGNGRAPVPFFADGAAWLATEAGYLLRAADPRGEWRVVCELGTAINAVAAEGSPSSVMH
ncbi:MAG: hypothetical protein V3V06_08970 [Dehalococcoidia bacterium]